MDEQVFHETISEIVSAIKEAGYDPYEQLMGSKPGRNTT